MQNYAKRLISANNCANDFTPRIKIFKMITVELSIQEILIIDYEFAI